MANRDLDGVYFFVERDGERQPVCFSDMTDVEMDSVMDGMNVEWLKNLCRYLGNTLKQIGDNFDIFGGGGEGC